MKAIIKTEIFNQSLNEGVPSIQAVVNVDETNKAYVNWVTPFTVNMDRDLIEQLFSNPKNKPLIEGITQTINRWCELYGYELWSF